MYTFKYSTNNLLTIYFYFIFPLLVGTCIILDLILGDANTWYMIFVAVVGLSSFGVFLKLKQKNFKLFRKIRFTNEELYQTLREDLTSNDLKLFYHLKECQLNLDYVKTDINQIQMCDNPYVLSYIT